MQKFTLFSVLYTFRTKRTFSSCIVFSWSKLLRIHADRKIRLPHRYNPKRFFMSVLLSISCINRILYKTEIFLS